MGQQSTILEVNGIELQIDDFLEIEAVRPVNLNDYLKELSIYQESLKLSPLEQKGSSS